MPRVLRIINRFNLGGPTYNAAYLTKYLSDDFKTVLIGGEKDVTEDSSEFIVRNLGIEPVIIPEMSSPRRLVVSLPLPKRLKMQLELRSKPSSRLRTRPGALPCTRVWETCLFRKSA